MTEKGFFEDQYPKNMKELSEVKPCKYDKTVRAVKECVVCDEGLCSACGWFLDRKIYCNECHNEELKKYETLIKEQKGLAEDYS